MIPGNVYEKLNCIDSKANSRCNRKTKSKEQGAKSKKRICFSTFKAKPKPVFVKPLAIAQKQQAKSWELRASTSLARLWQQQGKRHEAHKVLSEVYNWFTEGFDTKDLQEAKALLEDLEKMAKWANGETDKRERPT